VIDLSKLRTLRGLGAVPAANLRALGVYLRQYWRRRFADRLHTTSTSTHLNATLLSFSFFLVLIGFLHPATPWTGFCLTASYRVEVRALQPAAGRLLFRI